VAVVGQRRRGDIGDVVGVDEGLELVAGGQGDLTFDEIHEISYYEGSHHQSRISSTRP
jgi:hypothetical protein